MNACFQILSSSLYTNHPTIDGIVLTYSQHHNVTSKGNDYDYLYLYKLKKFNESPCLIKHQAMKAYRGVDVQLHKISTFAKVVVSFTL
jgi:hypothetical protein